MSQKCLTDMVFTISVNCFFHISQLFFISVKGFFHISQNFDGHISQNLGLISVKVLLTEMISFSQMHFHIS